VLLPAEATNMELSKTCRLIKTDNLSTFNEHEQKAIQESSEAIKNAHAPYSGFRVGASLLFDDMTTAFGNNQENPAYPSGLCAERVVLFHALATNPQKKIQILAISTLDATNNAHPFAPPCGACLQVIADVEARQKSSIKIILCNENEYFVADGVAQFLPYQFEF
jgi:cytidine deaminase